MNLAPDFDARTVQPAQGGGAHPPGIWDFTITNTYARQTKAGNAGMLTVEFTSPVGRMENNYNLFRDDDKAKEIAQKEFSALCHSVAIHRVTFPSMEKAAFELRGGKGRMEIVPQTNKAGEHTGYMEIKKVFDVQGNEPGKLNQQPVQSNQPQQQSAPTQQQPQGGGWSNQQATNQQQQPQGNNSNWSGGNQPQQQPANQQTAGSGWAQGNQPQGDKPAWAK